VGARGSGDRIRPGRAASKGWVECCCWHTHARRNEQCARDVADLRACTGGETTTSDHACTCTMRPAAEPTPPSAAGAGCHSLERGPSPRPAGCTVVAAPPACRLPHRALQEKEKLYLELKSILARQPGPEAAEQLSLYQVPPSPADACTLVGRCRLVKRSITAGGRQTLVQSAQASMVSARAGQPAGEDKADEGPGLRAKHVPSAGESWVARVDARPASPGTAMPWSAGLPLLA
jgi:hypothetical protein